MPKFPFDFEGACEKAQVDPARTRLMATRVEALLTPAMKVEGFYDDVLAKMDNMEKYSFNNVHILHRFLFEKGKLKLGIEPREKSMLFLLDYLVIAESLFTDVLDLLCFALIAAHHDLADFYRRKYVKKLPELEDIPLADKLRFLSLHRWKDADQTVDRDLRNAIAHGSYRITDEGLVHYKRRTLKEEDFDKKYEAVRNFVYEFWVGMNKFYGENYGVGFG